MTKPRPATRVLVVQDSPTQPDALVLLLEEAGYDVVSAGDGKEALAAALAQRFDVVISDFDMPEMDGYALCRALRADATLRHLTVILLTSLSDPRDVLRGLEAGADNFVRKPFDPDHLLGRIRSVLATRELRNTPGVHVGLPVQFRGQPYRFSQDRLQLLDVLLSTYEDALQQNAQLEDRIAQRTAALEVELGERARALDRQLLARQVLAILNEQADDTDVVRDVVAAIRRGTGFDAVGIRLKVGEEFPYFQTDGFSEGLVRKKRLLCGRADGGELPGQQPGSSVLPCTCGAVLAGLTRAELPFFTKAGSFWTNSATELLASMPGPAPGVETSNRCIRQGYESMALVPLRAGGEVLGLLQLNDRRKDLFGPNPEKIEFLEALGGNIGVALARRQAEARVQAVSRFPEENPHPVLRFEPDGTLQYANPAAAPILRLWGCAPGLLAPPDWVALVSDVTATGERRATEVSCFGRTYVFDIVPIPGAGYANAYGEDATEQQRLEAERAELQQQLAVSQKLEAIGSRAGGVAHDFNNLLTVIKGYTRFALKRVGDDQRLEQDLREVMSAADRAAGLTRQLLAFSRKQILEPEVLDLNETATGMEGMLHRLIGEGIELVLRLKPDLGLVLADPGQIEQVLMNLVVNACDAMPQGGRLTIETANVELGAEYAAQHPAVVPGPYVLLAVSDTGHGMDEATRTRLFEPFFTTKAKGKGTGLGLSMVHGIVKQSGGNIWVYSEPGLGTTFKIYLPHDESLTPPVPSGASWPPVRVAGTETILLVEDERAVRNIAARVLRDAGYTVLVADCGADALRVSAGHEAAIHLLLTDVVMPDMNGKALAERIVDVRPDTRVLFMSGYTDNAIVHHGRLDEGTHFLGKPFAARDLEAKVREVLDSEMVPSRWALPAPLPAEGPAEPAAPLELPVELRRRLRRAVVSARYDDLVELVEGLRDGQPELAARLRRMADLFDYDGIQGLLGEAGEESDAF